jgi:hypothetical protein
MPVWIIRYSIDMGSMSIGMQRITRCDNIWKAVESVYSRRKLIFNPCSRSIELLGSSHFINVTEASNMLCISPHLSLMSPDFQAALTISVIHLYHFIPSAPGCVYASTKFYTTQYSTSATKAPDSLLPLLHVATFENSAH